MLKTSCINPKIMAVLSSCGHGDKVLIADGNYPLDSNTNINAEKVYINLTQGIPKVTEVLKVMNETISVEKAEVMSPDEGKEPEIFEGFREILAMDLEALDRWKFYEQCKKENVKIAIATGDTRLFANILLTVGVVK